MKNGRKKSLGVALLGMDERSRRLLALFFKGPCEGFAEVVDEAAAQIDIIDTHFAHSEKLIEDSLMRTPARAIIVLTSQTEVRINQDNVLYVNKPIKVDVMIEAIEWAKDMSQGIFRQKPALGGYVPSVSFAPESGVSVKRGVSPPEFKVPLQSINGPSHVVKQESTPVYKEISKEQKKDINPEEQRKKSKYLVALSVAEGDFDSFIGKVKGINLNDEKERHLAAYDINNHYQGYVQSAFQSAMAKMQTQQLNSKIWRPLVILPHSREIWLDATDISLKEMAGVWLDTSTMGISPVDKELLQESFDLEKIQEMNAFLWKLALWTSKGRYPSSLDVDSPVFLSHWPDFTRYIVTPHALRITALLVSRGCDTMTNVAILLNIEIRYVYIFISAAHALGFASQANRQMDKLIKTTLPTTVVAKKSLFSKIISKLRGEK